MTSPWSQQLEYIMVQPYQIYPGKKDDSSIWVQYNKWKNECPTKMFCLKVKILIALLAASITNLTKCMYVKSGSVTHDCR